MKNERNIEEPASEGPMGQVVRWFLTAGIVYVAAVCYVAAAAVVLSRISPDFLAPAEWSWTGMQWGSFAGMMMGPLLGFTVLRDVHRAVRTPEDEVRWWPKADRRVLLTAAVVTSLALAGALFVGGAAWLRGFEPASVRYRVCWGFSMGALIGGTAATFGPFVLNRSLSEEA